MLKFVGTSQPLPVTSRRLNANRSEQMAEFAFEQVDVFSARPLLRNPLGLLSAPMR
jgi:hypothetical protein